MISLQFHGSKTNNLKLLVRFQELSRMKTSPKAIRIMVWYEHGRKDTLRDKMLLINLQLGGFRREANGVRMPSESRKTAYG